MTDDNETSSFFLPRSATEHLLYAQIRDDLRRDKSKAQIESFWGKYRIHAPNRFLREAQVDFYQRWWEMFLSVGLLNLNFEISTDKKDRGPDIKVILPNNKVVWIEAIAPNIGKNKDALPPIKNGDNLPEKEFLLRLHKALYEEKLIAFRRYRKKGLINADDHCIIALSSCALAQYGNLMDYPVPAPLKVLACAGNPALSNKGNYVTCREKIETNKKRKADMSLFNMEDFSIISAVLYSNIDILNSPNTPELSFQLFVNTLANNPIGDASFDTIETWFEERRNESQVVWRVINRSSDN
jgi:hypothetical protein